MKHLPFIAYYEATTPLVTCPTLYPPQGCEAYVARKTNFNCHPSIHRFLDIGTNITYTSTSNAKGHYAKINSLTNSTYSIIYHSNERITRAEFSMIMQTDRRLRPMDRKAWHPLLLLA